MSLLFTVIALAVPAYCYAWLVRSIDRYEKEPPKYLIAAFVWGAVPAIVVALILQILFSIPVGFLFGSETLSSMFLEAAIGAPVTEELLKGAAVAIIYLTRRREFDGWVDGIVYGAMAGFGFAYVENIFYLMSTTSTDEWVSLFILRTIVFGGLHGFWTALTGIGFGIARYMHNPLLRVLTIAGGLLLAMVGHLIHNAAITLIEVTSGLTILVAMFNYGILMLVMLILWFIAVRVDRKRLKVYLADEVPSVLSAQCYEAVCTPGNRGFMAIGMTTKQRRRLLQIAAELAQKKLQLQKMGEESGNSAEIARLREQLRQVSLSG